MGKRLGWALGLVVAVSLSAPVQAGLVGYWNFDGGNANDLSVVDGMLYLADGGAGIAVIDVSDPFHPSLLGTVDTPGTATDLAVAGGLLYLADGGGGYGNPFERDPASVRDDVIDGYVSRAAARADYGVVLTDALDIDWDETERLRG